MTKVYSHLSAEERVRIDEPGNRDGLGVNEIARRIGRDKSTAGRELRCGLWFASNENESYRPYRPNRLKRTSFDDLTDADLQAIVQETDDTSLKVLNWETPNEVWYRELGKLSSRRNPKTSVARTS